MYIQPVDESMVSAEVKPLLDDMKARFGGVPRSTAYLAHSAAALKGFFGLSGAAMTALTPRIREQLALYSAEYNDCSLCRVMHGITARRAGLSSEEIEAARWGEATDPKEAVALRLAAQILDRRGDVESDVLAEAQEAGIDDGDLLEILLIVTNNLMTNYFNRFVGLTADDLTPAVQRAAA